MEDRFVGAAEERIQVLSFVSLSDLAFGIHGLVVGDSGDKGTDSSGIRRMRVDKKAVRLFSKTHDGDVEAVNVEGTRSRGIHGHAPNFHDLG